MFNSVFLAVFLAALVFLALRRRARVALADGEGVFLLAMGALALLQGTFDHQVHVDDVLFTSIYVASFVVLGVYRGPTEGAIGAFFGVGLMMLVATFHALGGHAGGGIQLAEWVGFGIVGAIMGSAGGILSRLAPAYVPLAALCFLLFPAAFQPELLQSPTPWQAALGGIFLIAATRFLEPLWSGAEDARAA